MSKVEDVEPVQPIEPDDWTEYLRGFITLLTDVNERRRKDGGSYDLAIYPHPIDNVTPQETPFTEMVGRTAREE